MHSKIRQGLMCLLLLGGSICALGQTARFTGKVTDPQGALVPNAEIQIVNEESGVAFTAETDVTGSYTVPYLPAGRYRIVVTSEGFATAVNSGVNLSVGQALIYNVQLNMGGAQSKITVEGGAAASVIQVNTDNAEVSGTITGKEVAGLQLNGRNFSQLIALAPGVSNQTSQDEARVGMAGSVSYSVNGGRVEYNSFQVDGSEILNAGINKNHTSLIVTPSIDSIEEVKVLTSNYGAKYPSSGNGTTLITTKSGTDKYHGSLYEFLRNEAFNAKGYFDIGNRAPLYRRNDFGGTYGGPLSIPHLFNTRGRTHFFFSEEVRMETDPYAYRQGVPSLAERNGDFSDVCPYAPPGGYTVFDPYTGDHPDCPGNRSGANLFPPARTYPSNLLPSVSPVASALLGNGLIPVPNSTTGCTSSIGSCYLAEVSLPTFYREELVRIDHSLTSKEFLTFRYIHDEWNETAPVPQYATVQNSFPTIRNSFEGPGTSIVGSLVSQLLSRWSNDLTFSYTSSNDSLNDVAAPGAYLNRPASIDQSPAAGGLGYIFNNASYGKVPGIDIAGTNAAYGGAGFSVDPGYMPWKHSNPVYSVTDNVEKILGPHSLKFGAQFVVFHRTQTNGPIGAATGDVQGLMTFNGSVSGNSFADFLLMGGVPGYGAPVLGGISTFQQDSGQGTYHQSYQIIEPYFQDDWKVTRRLTLNAGVRVSLFGVYKEANHNAYNWTPKAFSSALSESVFVGAGTGQLTDSATNMPTPIYLKNGQVNPVVANGIVQCGVNGVPDGCMSGHLWNPAPRIGFAWDVFGNGKTAVRAGYGVFFEHGTADEANTGSLEGSAPLVLSMTQYNIAGAGCIGFVASGCGSVSSHPPSPGAFPLNVTAIPTQAVWPYVQQWSFGVEQELPRQMLTTFGYVGSKGTHLTLQREINQLIPTPAANNPFGPHEPLLQAVCDPPDTSGTIVPPVPGNHNSYFVLGSKAVVPSTSPAFINLQTACFNESGAGANPNAYRTFAPGLGNIYSLENTANSSYSALQFTLRRVAAPLTVGIAYTYSHSFDDSSDRSDSNFVNSFDVRSNRASSNYDQRHLFHVNYIYDLQLRRFLQRILSNINADPNPDNHSPDPQPDAFLRSRLFGLLLDHWQFSGITIFETGIPFSIINGGSSNGASMLDNAGVFNGVGAGSYPDICPSYSPVPGIPHVSSGSTSFGPLLRDPGEFCAPRGLTFGNAGRNVERNPGRLNFDMAMAKHFRLMEKANLEFRAEAFNVFNHTQFRIYDPTLGNQANNTATCYADPYKGTAASSNGGGFSAAGDANTNCLSNSSFLHPVDAHRPRTIQFGLKLAF